MSCTSVDLPEGGYDDRDELFFKDSQFRLRYELEFYVAFFSWFTGQWISVHFLTGSFFVGI